MIGDRQSSARKRTPNESYVGERERGVDDELGRYETRSTNVHFADRYFTFLPAVVDIILLRLDARLMNAGELLIGTAF
jgi:hypothetical protein